MLQWKILHNIYPTNILLSKIKVKENNKCSCCSDTVDVIEHFFVECPVVRHFQNFIEGITLRECGINVKLHLTDIMFGVQRSNIKENIIKKINHIILIAKMCISTFKKTNSKISLAISITFEQQLQIRKV